MPSQESTPKYKIGDKVKFIVDEDGYTIDREGTITSVKIEPTSNKYSISTTNPDIIYDLIPEYNIKPKTSSFGGKKRKSRKSRKSIKNLKEKRENLEDADKYTI